MSIDSKFGAGALPLSYDVWRSLARRLPVLPRYGIVSVVALAADVLTFQALIASGLQTALAGAAGYALGLILHYALSRHVVFSVIKDGKSEARRFAEFASTGAIGLGLTWGVIALATAAAVPALLAKLVAVAASFFVVFAVRRHVVFAAT